MDDDAGGGGVTGVDFSDERKAKDWLEAQSVEVRCAMASRAALRVCGNISLTSNEELPPIALAVLRGIIISTTRGYIQTANIEWLETAAQSLDPSTDRVSAAMSSDVSASCAANSADFAALAAADFSATSSRESIVYSAESASYAFIRTAPKSTNRSRLRASISRITDKTYSAASRDSKSSSVTTFATPVWPSGTVPIPIEENHEALLAFFNEDRATWSFWHDWYLAMWEGRFTDWGLAIEVAKIPNDVWGEGPEAVAAEIAKIKARRALESEIASLKAQLRRAHAVEAPAHRLHNNPPEAIENDQQIRNEITLIWDLLEEVETEIAEPAPSPAVLRGIADRLWEIPLRIAKYCGSIADVALKESAKVIGKTGTKAGIAWYLTDIAPQNEGVKAVVKAIWEFVKTLPPA